MFQPAITAELAQPMPIVTEDRRAVREATAAPSGLHDIEIVELSGEPIARRVRQIPMAMRPEIYDPGKCPSRQERTAVRIRLASWEGVEPVTRLPPPEAACELCAAGHASNNKYIA